MSSEQQRKNLFETIDAAACDEEEKADSKVIYDALARNKAALSGSGALPEQDKDLSERILDAAGKRSQELRGSASISAALQAEGRPVGRWLWVLWAIALIAAGIAIWVFW